MVKYPELPPFTLRKCEVGHQILWMDFVFDVIDLKDIGWAYQVVGAFMDVCLETGEYDRLWDFPPMHLSRELFWHFGAALDRNFPGASFAAKEGIVPAGPVEVLKTYDDGSQMTFQLMRRGFVPLDPLRYRMQGIEIFEYKPAFVAQPRSPLARKHQP